MNRSSLLISALFFYFMCSSARLSFAYYDDTHYSFTYYMARACGMTPAQAYRLSSACVSVDYSHDTEPEQYSNVFDINAVSGSAQTPRVNFHAFMNAMKYPNCLKSEDEENKARADIKTQHRKLWDEAVKSGNPGIFLHFLQDETSHGNYSSWGGHWASLGAYNAGLPLGPTCDYLSYGDPDRHYGMMNESLKSIIAFMKLNNQTFRRPKWYAEIIPVFNQLCDANPAPRPLGMGDLDTVMFGSVTTIVVRAQELKSGPDAVKAYNIIDKALDKWGEVKVFPIKPHIYKINGFGYPDPDTQKDQWTLYGDLTLRLKSTEDPDKIEITVNSRPTRRSDPETELVKPQTVTTISQPIEYKHLPVGEIYVRVKIGDNKPKRYQFTINKVHNEETINLDPKTMTILSADVTPKNGKPGNKFKLKVTYRVNDASVSDPVDICEETMVNGQTPLPEHDRNRLVSDDQVHVAEFEEQVDHAGDYKWEYTFEASNCKPATGNIPFTVSNNETAPNGKFRAKAWKLIDTILLIDGKPGGLNEGADFQVSDGALIGTYPAKPPYDEYGKHQMVIIWEKPPDLLTPGQKIPLHITGSVKELIAGSRLPFCFDEKPDYSFGIARVDIKNGKSVWSCVHRDESIFNIPNWVFSCGAEFSYESGRIGSGSNILQTPGTCVVEVTQDFCWTKENETGTDGSDYMYGFISTFTDNGTHFTTWIYAPVKDTSR